LDIASVVGLLLGIGGILLGNLLEGGHVSSLAQGAAFVIVFSGTFGAVLLSSSMEDVRRGIKLFRESFRKENSNHMNSIKTVIELARLARKEGVIAIEPRLNSLNDKFTAGVIRTIVDGIDTQAVRHIWEATIEAEEEKKLAGAKIWTDAGGFAPTVGIIGAVLGLIHVMGNLSDTSKLGAGIAVAFVATVYGVGSANLIFLPIGSKIKKRIQAETREKYMILEGALEIPGSLNPQIIEQKMKAYLAEEG
jgi:chemotaxis protein MotA